MKKTKHIKHAVILVNYKGWQETIICINSIRVAKDSPHVIVVDNGSPDESVAQLQKAFPDLDLIVSPTNGGFSAANNIGIKKALRMGAKVVYVLNNDTEVDKNLFFRAYRYVEGKNRIAGAKIYYAQGYEFHKEQKGKGNIIWYAGGYTDWAMALSHHRGVDEEDHGQYDSIQDVEFVTGCFMAIPRQVISKIGLLDEKFFLYLEDSDYCLNALHHKVEVKYNPSLIVYHRNSSSTVAGSPLVDYYITRNRFIISRRYGSRRLYGALVREALIRNWNNRIRRQAFLDYVWGRLGNRTDVINAVSAKGQT